MTAPVFVLRFDFPDCPAIWAGRTKDGGLGWAPSVLTAMHFASAEDALRMARNGYGQHHLAHASADELAVED